jgi:hypothetical protein
MKFDEILLDDGCRISVICGLLRVLYIQHCMCYIDDGNTSVDIHVDFLILDGAS